ncbi:inosine/xanthosine triphosphatase [Belliella marina]|uniref:Probable inosine/xanthosine triphosphatase n=1 Tax=Belliella marina TaxID=1644146 RepID=A0ABW4VT77_9BACT
MAFPQRKNIKEEKRQQLIIVGSKNPVKINSTDIGFHQAFDSAFLVEGLNVSSEVSDQPVGDEETYLGANNRAKNAKLVFPEADYWVGIEGGVDEVNGEMHAFAWVVVLDRKGKTGKAKTATFYLPSVVTELVKGGMELGMADDQVFSRENSKQGNGSVGILTKGVVNRKEYYSQAVILALIPFLNESIYN